MDFAKRYIAKCEERHGLAAVEAILDSAHALMDQGVFRYRRPPRLSSAREQERAREQLAYEEQSYNDLWRTLPGRPEGDPPEARQAAIEERRKKLKLPEENLLYFLEKNSPVLEPWQREILRIVRIVAQYFYPQRQTKVMNEGCATFVHHYITLKLYDEGRISEGVMLEILHSHSNVVLQPDFDDARYSGLNPYALGFAMMQDIRRICETPTSEDREWFPDLAGTGAWREALLDAWANYRDDSFILQYLSPALMRRLRLFLLRDTADQSYLEVASIHDERGYQAVRSGLAERYDLGAQQPDIEVMDVDLSGDRHLRLRHKVRESVFLDTTSRNAVVQHVRRLWGYKVSIVGEDAGRTFYDFSLQ